MWGVAQEGMRSCIYAIFNFDGLGKSGNLQNVRGLYLIERAKHTQAQFYKIGNIVWTEK
jgi:hypothetical protein